VFFHFTYQLMKKGTTGRGNLVDSLAILRWEGTAEEEKGIEKATGKVRVEVDPKYYRPTEVVSIGFLGSFPGLIACSMECERVIMFVMFVIFCALQEFLLGDASKAIKSDSSCKVIPPRTCCNGNHMSTECPTVALHHIPHQGVLKLLV